MSNPPAIKGTTPLSSHDQSTARDAVLFLGLGLLAQIVNLGLCAWAGCLDLHIFLNGLSSQSEKDSIIVLSGSIWIALTLGGLYKLIRALRANVNNGWTRAASSIATLNLGTSIIVACIFTIPEVIFHAGIPSRSVAAVVGLIPLSVFSVGLCWLARRKSLTQNSARRAACLLGLSFMLLAYKVAIALEAIYETRYFNQGWVPDRLLGFPAFCGSISNFLSAVCFALTLRELLALRRAGIRSLAAGWVLCGAWLQFAALLITAIFSFEYDVVVAGGFAGVVLSAAIAGILGALIARVWRPESSWLLRYASTAAIFCALLLCLPLAVAVSVATLANNDYQRREFILAERTWMTYEPDVVRVPVMNLMIARYAPINRYANWAGLKSLDEVKLNALYSRIPQYYFMWSQRDPAAALQTALNIAPGASKSTIPTTTCDIGAGIVIARLASEAQILERVNGNFSDDMLDGMLLGFQSQQSDPRYSRFQRAYEERFLNRTPDAAHISNLVLYDIRLYERCLTRMLNIRPPDYLALNAAMVGLRGCVPLVSQSALRSNDSVIRSLALTLGESDSVNLPEMLACASGKLPGATPNEQRIATQAIWSVLNHVYLHSFCVKPILANGAPKPGTPLTPEETEELEDLMRRADKELRR